MRAAGLTADHEPNTPRPAAVDRDAACRVGCGPGPIGSDGRSSSTKAATCRTQEGRSMNSSEAVGTVGALWRFPVKSMLGEQLDAADLGDGGIVGDRAYAVRD